MGNPTNDDQVVVQVRGETGESMRIGLANSQGQVVSQQTFTTSGAVEQKKFKLGRLPGIYFLKVSTPTQSKTVKVLRNEN
jgi:hypothetical protein